ncbi:arsenate reductase family protein [Eisenibacter elegans]|jgi:arsenate reductase|uniref:arsenate reductase family protein n=1 Tax=Eisenibacter elegans TaxID=997 RepID=UPI0003F7015C|nr:ArsC/Spx/MgsR family protein [Eisenibacter elegans]
MRKKVYHLSTCQTCQKMMKAAGVDDSFEQQDIKTQALTEAQVEEMIALAGSAEAIFSRRSRQYQARNLKDQTLTEADYRRLILEEYTFLKRPVFLIGEQIFVGNAKAALEGIQAALKA